MKIVKKLALLISIMFFVLAIPMSVSAKSPETTTQTFTTPITLKLKDPNNISAASVTIYGWVSGTVAVFGPVASINWTITINNPVNNYISYINTNVYWSGAPGSGGDTYDSWNYPVYSPTMTASNQGDNTYYWGGNYYCTLYGMVTTIWGIYTLVPSTINFQI